MKYTHQYGSNLFDPMFRKPEGIDADEIVEYLHEVDVCGEEEFWWDEEDRHEL